MKLSDDFAEVISLIFNPVVVLMPAPFYLVFETTENLSLAFLWTMISFAFILAFVVFVLVGIKFGFISNIDISKREERPKAFLFGIILGLIYLLTLFLLNAPAALYAGILALVGGIVVMGFANTFTKVSWHLAVFSSFLTFLVLTEGWPFLLGFAFAPVLAWARIKTRNHTRKQTILGAGLGILTTSLIYAIFKYIVHV